MRTSVVPTEDLPSVHALAEETTADRELAAFAARAAHDLLSYATATSCALRPQTIDLNGPIGAVIARRVDHLRDAVAGIPTSRSAGCRA